VLGIKESEMIPEYTFDFSDREIHVWTLHLEAPQLLAPMFEPILSADEKNRAAHFRFEHPRNLFVSARGALRCLLGRYLDIHPARIRFKYGSKGKPALASNASIEFNTTHSGHMAAFAFTVGCQIGIDLEQVRPLHDALEIANRYFCSDEAAEIVALPPNEQERSFFLCWTRKEAYIKAIGDGLSAPLHEFRVTIKSSEPARLVHLAREEKAAQEWTLHDLRLDPNYASAVAYRDRRRTLCIIPIVDAGELTGLL
jgi:4'-phosphopantetheinyl transferase